jgi:hypothetical protein
MNLNSRNVKAALHTLQSGFCSFIMLKNLKQQRLQELSQRVLFLCSSSSGDVCRASRCKLSRALSVDHLCP